MIPSGVLYLSPAIALTGDKLEKAFSDTGAALHESDGLFSARVSREQIAQVMENHRTDFTDAELSGTKALFVPPEREPTIHDLIHMESLLSIFSRLEGNWLLDMLRERRLRHVFHPIRNAENPEIIYGREVLLRGVDRDGNSVNPGIIFSVARKADLLFYLDREARISAVNRASEKRLKEKLFINFNPTSIYSPDYCLKTTMEAIEATQFRPEDIVFELVESDYIRDIPRMLEIVDFYRSNGFQVALDDLGSGYSSLNLLHQLHPDIVKLDMDMVMGVSSDTFKQSILKSIIELSRQMKITTIAEGVEDEDDYRWVKNLGVDLVQGFLFGKPQE
ncbi:EAL domain protein [Salinispira pacifica]|uniref:EAL domain protein n=2 Tax=Salinispira pacifica TaxID=1307761 RepID=V5WDN7_9SPIO|nr:EAL domain protein [Salinispira pacifica]